MSSRGRFFFVVFSILAACMSQAYLIPHLITAPPGSVFAGHGGLLILIVIAGLAGFIAAMFDSFVSFLALMIFVGLLVVVPKDQHDQAYVLVEAILAGAGIVALVRFGFHLFSVFFAGHQRPTSAGGH